MLGRCSVLASSMVACLLCLPASAFLRDLDTVTRDTDTGLDWLDLTETLGASFNDIVARTGVWRDNGWRHATIDEVCALFVTHLGEPIPCPGTVKNLPVGTVTDLQKLLGITGVGPTRTLGWCDNESSDPKVALGRLVKDRTEDQISVLAQASGAEDTRNPIRGHFLVRPVPDEIPFSTIVLVPRQSGGHEDSPAARPDQGGGVPAGGQGRHAGDCRADLSGDQKAHGLPVRPETVDR